MLNKIFDKKPLLLIVEEYQKYLLGCKKQIDILPTDSRINKTVNWLIMVQNNDGSWGNSDVATTSLTMLAFYKIMNPNFSVIKEDAIKESIAKACTFLDSSYKQNKWEEALWDTSVSIRALKKAGRNNPVVDIAEKWLSKQEWCNTIGPHHYAQRLITLKESGHHRDFLEDSAKKILHRLRDADYHYSQYVLAQCYEAIYDILPNAVELIEIIDRLLIYLENARLDNSNFINICYSLQAISLTHDPSHRERSRMTVSSLFGEHCFRTNGSWYRSEISTAWALITLLTYSNEIILSAPYNELFKETDHISNRIIEYVDHEHKKYLKGLRFEVIISVLWALLLSFLITYTSIYPDLPYWIRWAIGVICVILIGKTVTALWGK